MKVTVTLMVVLAAALASAGMSGCSIACSLAPRPTFDIAVVDSASSGRVNSQFVTIIVTEGAFRDSTQVAQQESERFQLIIERPGTYRVEVRSVGYKTWILEKIRVESDDCHVQTSELVVRLQPV